MPLHHKCGGINNYGGHMSIYTVTKSLTSFYHNGELYIRCIPAKSLFNSTLVHEVVNRGDVFGLRVSDQKLTIISGKSLVEHTKVDVTKDLTPQNHMIQVDLFSEPLTRENAYKVL